MIGLLAIAASAIPAIGLSDFAADGHTHQWADVENSAKATVIIDTAWQGKHTVNDIPYPTALLRIMLKSANHSGMIYDYKMAVDCKKNGTALLEIAVTNLTAKVRSISQKSNVKFQYTPKPDDKVAAAMLTTACRKKS